MTKKPNLHDNQIDPDLAVLVGVGVNEIIDETALNELAALCDTCNIIEVARVIQNRKDVDVTYYVGKGKVDEIKQLVTQTAATVVVFDVELSGSKVRNLEAALGVSVLDRSKIILDIFAQRAQSLEGKLQVELAQLRYNLPRLVGAGGVMSQMKNSVGMRGPGEKKLELDKRKIRDEITALEERLAKVAEHRETNKKTATKNQIPRVCLVGYTNSGKSTLLNTIAKTSAYAADKLFATLDPKTARVYITQTPQKFPSTPTLNQTGTQGHQILLTDTVGFIDRLPHEFIRAFESTLDEARTADLLLHVVDASNPAHEKQISVVNSVLKKIAAAHVPTILVYNKTDCCPASSRKGQTQTPQVYISALKNQGIDALKQKIVDFLL